MSFALRCACVLTVARVAFAAPLLATGAVLVGRQDNVTILPPYSLPNTNSDVLRTAGIQTKQATFLYGPAVGTGPYSPTGVLGDTYLAVHSAETDSELAAQEVISQNDSLVAKLNTYDGLTTLDDYTKLYDGEWQPSSQPTGQDPGMLANYTQDLLFSMERLSVSPFAVRRLVYATDSLPFAVDDATAINIAGQTLVSLLASGRLFYADHRNQSTLVKSPGKYGVACDAYFYISQFSGDFLPLAIRTNAGSDLIYTPEDSANDWLLAKMMFNNNDFFMAQIDHFSRNHFTNEIVYEAAVRTLSDDHPVLAILDRLLYGAFAIRPLALLVLIRPGGVFDEYFSLSGAAVASFADQTYFNGYAGAIQANYFETNLERRGLINSPTGPALKSFPYYSDGLPLYNAIHDFVTAFTSSYYSSDAAVAADTELQAWLIEANGPAKAIDFPTTLSSVAELTTLLTEIAHHSNIAHHAVNLNNLITGAGTLPFHPTAFYQDLPTAKGVHDIVPFLPPLGQCLGFIEVTANFARPLIAGSNRTMVHMFDDPIMLSRMNDATRAANDRFKDAMLAQSQVVKSRTFDADGLSQGMPFVWKALDPDVAAWSLTI